VGSRRDESLPGASLLLTELTKKCWGSFGCSEEDQEDFSSLSSSMMELSNNWERSVSPDSSTGASSQREESLPPGSWLSVDCFFFLSFFNIGAFGRLLFFFNLIN